jgi:hypothetical protein
VSALGGNDRVSGQGGDDILRGGVGNDQLFGGGGDDDISDTQGPSSGLPADRDLIHPGSETNEVNVADGDDFDIVCVDPGAEPGGIIRFDNGDSVPLSGAGEDPIC